MQERSQINTTPPLSGPDLVSQTNAALGTIATDFAGDTDPAGIASAFMLWADTANGVLKRRNATNTQWVTVGELWTNSTNHGQCRFRFVSSTQCQLYPYNGNKLMIGGAIQTIPAGGVSLTNAGLSADSTYYVYAFMSGGAIGVEASLTAYATDTTTGISVKNGDASRTLIGAVVLSGTSFIDTTAKRHVASYFNRRPKDIFVSTSGNTAGTSPQVAGDGVSAFTWAGESVTVLAIGAFTMGLSNTTGSMGVMRDVVTAVGGSSGGAPIPSGFLPAIAGGASVPAEGYHFWQAAISTSSGGSLFSGSWTLTGEVQQ